MSGSSVLEHKGEFILSHLVSFLREDPDLPFAPHPHLSQTLILTESTDDHSSYYYHVPNIVLSFLGSNENSCTIRTVAGIHSVLSVCQAQL